MLLRIIFGLIFSTTAWAQFATQNKDLGKLRGSITQRDFGLDQAVIARMLADEELERIGKLKEAKFFLINGETELARQSLFGLIKRSESRYAGVLKRYLAMANFQDGRWKESLELLSSPELTAYPQYGRICPLKIVVRIVMQNLQDLKSEWDRCKLENTKDLYLKDMVWMELMVELASRSSRGIGVKRLGRYNLLNTNNEDLKVVLKLSLYLNIERMFVDQIEGLDYSAIEDEELRAIVAQIYFRQGRLAQAWKFMEDIATPNVENMKGNLWLLRGKQELAYAQFKLALKQKSNSHNAVERALPLAWSLKQWKEGFKLSERIYTHEKNRLQKLTTTAAFAVAQEQWADAQSRLDVVHQEAGEGTAQEVSQLSTYVALRMNDPKKLFRYANRSCEGGDLSACWLLSATLIWEDMPSLIKREEPSHTTTPMQKELVADSVEAFKEDVTIDQRDIDELDDALIKLIKN